jgi:hypothetical protein
MQQLLWVTILVSLPFFAGEQKADQPGVNAETDQRVHAALSHDTQACMLFSVARAPDSQLALPTTCCCRAPAVSVAAQSASCPADFEPTLGTDGLVYLNPCVAEAQGATIVKSESRGPCPNGTLSPPAAFVCCLVMCCSFKLDTHTHTHTNTSFAQLPVSLQATRGSGSQGPDP